MFAIQSLEVLSMLKKGAQRERVLHLLEEEGGVTEENVRKISMETGVPEADIWGAGLFYSLIDKPGQTGPCV